MKSALRTRYFVSTALIAIVCGLMAGGALSTLDVGLPTVGIPSIAPTIPFPVIPALIIGVFTHWASTAGELPWMDASSRNIVLHSVAIYTTAWFFGLAAAAISMAVSSENGDFLLIIRDFAGLALMTLGARSLGAGRYAGVIPPTYVLITCFFARSHTGAINSWAWPMDRDPANPIAIITILVCLALTLGNLWRPTSHRNYPWLKLH